MYQTYREYDYYSSDQFCGSSINKDERNGRYKENGKKINEREELPSARLCDSGYVQV